MGAGEPKSFLICDFSSSPLHLSKNKILHGACPERDSSVASLLQNDRSRRVQNDIVVPVALSEAKSL